MAGVHRYKLKTPAFNGDYAMYEEWRYKFQAYMGLQSTEHDRFMRESERATARIQDTDLGAAATRGSRQMETVIAGDEVRTNKRDIRRSSNSVQTTQA